MEKLFKSYLIQTLVITLSALITGGLIFLFVVPQFYFPAFPFVFIVFPSVSIYVHSLLLRTSVKKNEQFNMAFTLSFLLKLVIYAAFVGISLSVDKTNYKVFVIFTLSAYVIYTVHETRAIVKAIQNLN